MARARGTGVKCGIEGCGAWALRSTHDSEEGPRCFIHSLTDEERRAHASRAARANNVKRRGDVEASSLADLKPDLTLRDVMPVIREALTSVNELGQPDYSARLAAVAVLLLSFPRYLRDTPEHTRELLERTLPESIPFDPERQKLDAAFRALRREWFSIPAVHPLRGLVARPLPRNFVPPWLDYSDVVKAEAPKDVPLAEADLFRLPDGTMALRRPGELPLALGEAEDEGGLIRAVVNLA